MVASPLSGIQISHMYVFNEEKEENTLYKCFNIKMLPINDKLFLFCYERYDLVAMVVQQIRLLLTTLVSQCEKISFIRRC